MRGPFFSFNDTATTENYTLSLHDALPNFSRGSRLLASFPSRLEAEQMVRFEVEAGSEEGEVTRITVEDGLDRQDRKSTRLNSSHANILYAVFCFKIITVHTPDFVSCSSQF